MLFLGISPRVQILILSTAVSHLTAARFPKAYIYPHQARTLLGTSCSAGFKVLVEGLSYRERLKSQTVVRDSPIYPDTHHETECYRPSPVSFAGICTRCSNLVPDRLKVSIVVLYVARHLVRLTVYHRTYPGYTGYSPSTSPATIERQWTSYNPVLSVSDPMMTCNGGTSASLNATIAAGDSMCAFFPPRILLTKC